MFSLLAGQRRGTWRIPAAPSGLLYCDILLFPNGMDVVTPLDAERHVYAGVAVTLFASSALFRQAAVMSLAADITSLHRHYMWVPLKKQRIGQGGWLRAGKQRRRAAHSRLRAAAETLQTCQHLARRRLHARWRKRCAALPSALTAVAHRSRGDTA